MRKIGFASRIVIASAIVGIVLFGGALHYWCKGSYASLHDSWLSHPAENFDWSDMQKIAKERMLNVRSVSIEKACQRLEKVSFVALTDAEVSEVCGDVLRNKDSSLKPYLIRCACLGKPTDHCSAEQKADVLSISCGMLTHWNIHSLDHSPVVVYLASPPNTLYVSFWAAE